MFFGFKIVVGSVSLFFAFSSYFKELNFRTWSELANINRYQYSYSVGTKASPAIDTYLNRLSGRLARPRPRPPPRPPTPVFWHQPSQPPPPPRPVHFAVVADQKSRKGFDTKVPVLVPIREQFYLQIQPYIHNYCNNMADKDQLTAITFPDVDPNMLPEDSKQVFLTVILSFDPIFL
jgi:hypothetical protein